MIPTDTAPPAVTFPARRRWVIWGAMLALLALIMLVALHPDLRALAASTWRELRSISPAALTVIVVLKVLQALLSSLSWRNALQSTWPHSHLSYRFVLGVDQGQDVVNTVLPGRAGTWAMLAVMGMAIRGARAPTLLAVWGVQNIAFGLFAAVMYVLVAVGLPGRNRESEGWTDRLFSFATERPILAAAIAAGLVILLGVVAVRGRTRLAGVVNSVRLGLAILRTPGRYLRLMFLPALASYLFRCAAYVVLLAAFGIPVTIWTLALALGSHALAGAVRVTPGGLGTTQAIDVVALHAYADPDVVTAYSLAGIALTAIVSFAVAAAALLSVSGWHGMRTFLRHLRRGELMAGLHSIGSRQRALRSRAVRRKPPSGPG